MNGYRVPIEKPSPEPEALLDAMSGRKAPSRAPMVEYLIDNAVMQPILEDMIGRRWIDTSEKSEYMGGQMNLSGENLAEVNAWLDNQIAFWYHMG